MKDQEDKPNPLGSSLQRLSYAVPIVTDRLSKFSVGKNRILSDLCFLGYLLHFKDNIIASEILLKNARTGIAPFSNVRGAFEATEDALYLASQEPSERECLAAEIRVFERFEHADAKAKFIEATPEMNHSLTRDCLYGKTKASIKRDIATLGRANSTSANLLEKSLEEYWGKLNNPKFRHRTHCVPVKYKRLYLQEKYGGEGYSAESMHSYYSDLSRFTHPRYRADSFEPAHGPPSPDSLDPISGVRVRAAELATFTAHFMWISLNVYAMRKPLYKIKQLTPAKFSLT